ncbi:riboflavin synthase [Paucilactobacillus nenjiangensis]|uniref:Riboflavin synthase n=1 Tax=Paucilactobacillus nenjiangensis TaxID=1296540 RepID=A0A5P1X138_9LACO|nr:riboflavin synthase [Paucilactobacillus nenjiangensis]QER67612.1 riboflavin synthase [Paucilactobacillus nenjiangensis]
MFTGLIQAVGTVKSIQRSGQHSQVTIAADSKLLEDYQIGDSMAINGVCLTAIQVNEGNFTVDVMPTTSDKTTFKQLAFDARVNLERAMPANGRFEGHIVAGHVDTTTRVKIIRENENSVQMTFVYPASLQGQIVAEGSIAINGTSLTVATVGANEFSISLIPHSLTQTNFGQLKIGDQVNLETDMLAKYVQSLLGGKTYAS